jgi:hypothetical protein
MCGLAWAQTLYFNVSAGDGRRDRSAGERFRENREIPDHKACPVSVRRVTNLITGTGTAVDIAVRSTEGSIEGIEGSGGTVPVCWMKHKHQKLHQTRTTVSVSYRYRYRRLYTLHR